MLASGVVLLVLACPPGDKAAWNWRSHVRLEDGTELVLPETDARPVLLVFSSSWATPCLPLLRDLAGFTDRARVLVVKADQTAPAVRNDSLGLEVLVPTDDGLLDRLEISVLPTVVLFDRSGRQVERFEGYSSKVAAEISTALDKAMEPDSQ